MRNAQNGAGLAPVTDEDESDLVVRGRALKRRRLRHNFSTRSLAEAIKSQGGKMDRGTIGRVEDGEAEPETADRLEAWFDRYEEEIGDDPDTTAEQIEVIFRNVFGVGEIIYKGSADNFPEVEPYIERLMQRERESDGDQ